MNSECKIFYEKLRQNTKFYGEDIVDIEKELRGQFNQADDYFSQSINIFNKKSANPEFVMNEIA